VCTAGGFELLAFALADDGYLCCYDGEVYSGSDWMPKEAAMLNLPCRDLLVARYPIRKKDDLLPLFSLGSGVVLPATWPERASVLGRVKAAGPVSRRRR
jgi:hypothetical protein